MVEILFSAELSLKKVLYPQALAPPNHELTNPGGVGGGGGESPLTFLEYGRLKPEDQWSYKRSPEICFILQ